MINNLKFVGSEKIRLQEGYKMMESVHKGKFTRDELTKTLQHIADESNKKKLPYKMGVTYHYKQSGLWMPAIMRNANDAQKVWDVDYAQNPNQNFVDEIDEAVFWIVNDDHVKAAGKTLNFRRHLKAENQPKLMDEKLKKIDKSIFNK